MKNLENIIDKEKFIFKPEKMFFCLSNKIRLNIILLLSKNKMTVNQISNNINVSQPEASAQLSVLQNYNIVQSWQVGMEKYYKIIPESIESLTSWLDDIAISINMNYNNETDTGIKFDKGRRCYDYIAGKKGVMILKSMLVGCLIF